MDMTRERISCSFDPGDMSLCLHVGYSFVRAALACAILERTSPVEPQSETAAPRRLKLSLLTVTSLDAIGAVCHQFGLFSTYLFFAPCAAFVEVFN